MIIFGSNSTERESSGHLAVSAWGTRGKVKRRLIGMTEPRFTKKTRFSNTPALIISTVHCRVPTKQKADQELVPDVEFV
jgi:hypothetical protein